MAILVHPELVEALFEWREARRTLLDAVSARAVAERRVALADGAFAASPDFGAPGLLAAWGELTRTSDAERAARRAEAAANARYLEVASAERETSPVG